MSEVTAPEDLAVIESTAVRLLTGREHSRSELQAKLAARHAEPELLEQVLDRLETQGFLDDARFIETFIDQRCRKGFGPLRIRADLREKGVTAERIEQSLDSAGIDWQEQLEAVARRKFGGGVPADRREMVRRGRFLEQRGFPVSLIRRYLDGPAA